MASAESGGSHRDDGPMGNAALRVEVVYSPGAGAVDRTSLELPAPVTLAQALAASGLVERHPEVQALPAGIWGRLQPTDTPLRDRDRVEVYRPLLVDPKEARRLRYRRQGEATAGSSRR
jgi:putative ubiquitin-RnfH superfamily antitoxin RatB of RatAB toxin-antitoxin module